MGQLRVLSLASQEGQRLLLVIKNVFDEIIEKQVGLIVIKSYKLIHVHNETQDFQIKAIKIK